MFAIQQRLWSDTFVQDISGRQWNVDGVKTLIKKTDMTGSVDLQRASGRPQTARVQHQRR